MRWDRGVRVLSIGLRRWRAAPVICALLLFSGPGCAGRYLRMDEKGLTCGEAYQIAIAAVGRMNYAIDSSTKPTPGSPGVITATHTEGTTTRGLMVQVFCTSLGAAIEAKTDQGGLAELNFPAQFRRSFESAAVNRVPQRQPAESGLDVLLTPERGNPPELGIDVSAIGVLPVSVRISNRSARVYGFRVKDVVLKTDDGARSRPLGIQDISAQLSPADTDRLRQKALADRDIQAGETMTGFLFFPFKAYARARVVLTDRASDEPEGFSIEF
jgi:hypothetical protein